MDTEIEIYKGKKLSSLFRDIVSNSEHKRAQIELLINDLRTFIKSPNDALSVVPLIREYLDVGVKNDDQLVKLAAVVQRIMVAQQAAEEVGSSFGITDEERKALLAEVEKLKTDVDTPVNVTKAVFN
jgi:hypothetical protein